MLRFVVCLVVLALFTLPALADVAPPPPKKGFKRVPYEHLLKLEREISGYKFYTFQRLGLSGQEKIQAELKLETKTGIPVPSSESYSVRTGVVAVPQKLMDELKTAENLAKILGKDAEYKLPAGVVVYETRGTEKEVKESDPRDKVENVITISPDQKAGVKFTAMETAAPQSKGAAPTTSSRESFSSLVASVALGLAIATLAVWIASRRMKYPSMTVAGAHTTVLRFWKGSNQPGC